MTDNLQLHNWSMPAAGLAQRLGSGDRRQYVHSQDDHLCWLSESGKDKGSLTTDDFLQVEIASNRAPSGRKPSAETGLHTLIYRLFPQTSTLLHVHTVNATVLSRLTKTPELHISGFEMQKSPHRANLASRYRDDSGVR